MQANDLRKGMVVLWNGDLCKVMEFHHHTPGNLRAMVQAKLRNLRTGNQFEHRFRSQDEVEQAWIDQHEMEYMYSDGHAHHFMNTENYEQVEISEDDLGGAASWLSPGVKLNVQFHETRPIGSRTPKSPFFKAINAVRIRSTSIPGSVSPLLGLPPLPVLPLGGASSLEPLTPARAVRAADPRASVAGSGAR